MLNLSENKITGCDTFILPTPQTERSCYTNVTGEIPVAIKKLILLTDLNLSMNELTGRLMRYRPDRNTEFMLCIGCIPDAIGDLHNLEEIRLSENTLQGGTDKEYAKVNWIRD